MLTRLTPTALLFLCLTPLACFGAETITPANIPPLEQLVPADKKLDPAWVKSLTERGAPQVCAGAELNSIGMPVGGLFSGQIYIGGNGQLWNWDIFNDYVFTGWSGTYVSPKPFSPLEQKFSLAIDGVDVPLDATGFSDITFRGEYPVALVNYQDAAQPVQVQLRAFSPFIPLNLDDSCLPLTVMHYTVKNTSDHPVKVAVKGTLENFVLDRKRAALNGTRLNKVTTDGPLTLLETSVSPAADAPKTADLALEDWSKPDFGSWKVEGVAFGDKPLHKKELTPEQIKAGFENLGADSENCVTSLPAVTAATPNLSGSLTSAPFTVERRHLYLWLRSSGLLRGGSGADLLVDGQVVASIRPTWTRIDARQLHLHAFDLSAYAGKQAEVRLVHDAKDTKAGLTVGKIFQSDREILHNAKTGKIENFADAEGNGTMALALLDGPADLSSGDQQAPATQKLVGSLGRTVELPPGASKEITYVVAWNFPNMHYLNPALKSQGRWYASKFPTAGDAVRYFVQNRQRLTADTETWRATWYDSSLPYWFLDRTMIPVCNLATSTNHRFKNGRWWAWEGVGSCEGTCGHVYSYAQSVAALFPSLEREQREQVDFGTSLSADGWIDCRGECKGESAVDAQACYVLRALREHRMSADSGFLQRLWPRVKQATDYLIGLDGKESGLLSGAQHNTLDAKWYGEVAWLSGQYQAALLATAEMSRIMGDAAYAEKCTRIAETGQKYMAANLFNGEYYQNKLDPAHADSINSGSGCLIDQLSGQTWATLLDLPRVFPKPETMKTLQSIWRYNFCPDAGGYRTAYKSGRRYADAGEAGVLMCTFPKPDWDFFKSSGKGQSGLYAGYFNECMTGFEHHLAGLMIREGMTTEGLAIERAIHDRYAPAKRNPYNEIECGDFYGRAMASYGVFLAACGFEYDGPAGVLGFAPQLTPDNFTCPFTTAEGWGTYRQQHTGSDFQAQIQLKWGKLKLTTLRVSPNLPAGTELAVTVEGSTSQATAVDTAGRVSVKFAVPVEIAAGQTLSITLKAKK